LTAEAVSRRWLGNERAVVAFLAAASMITVAAIAWISIARRGIFDPNSLPIFQRLFFFGDYWISLLFLPVLLLALVPRVQRLGWRLALACGRYPSGVALATLAALACGSAWIYQRHPLALDEFVPVMQSEILLAGRLLGEFPVGLIDWLVYPPFQNYFIHVSHETGAIMSAYWPGFALLLVPFTALGVPWLCNPVLGALAVWVLHRLALDLTASREAAGTTVLLSMASSAFMINAISFYSMTAHLLCNALFVLLLLRPDPTRALLAGLVGGFALVLHNPVPHALFAAPWLLWLMADRRRWPAVAAIAVGYLPWVVIAGFGWQYLMHGLHAAASAVAGTTDPLSMAAGTATSVFTLPTRDLLLARAIGLAKLWLWAVPGLVLLALLGFWRHRTDTRFRLLLASAVLTFVGFLFVPVDQGHGWGFRYFHSVWFVLPLFAAAAIVPLIASGGRALADWLPAIVRYVQGVAVVSALLLVPLAGWLVGSFMSAHLAQLPSTDAGQARVVIVGRALGYYAQDLVQNDPFLRDPVIRMASRGRALDHAMIAQYFPDLVLLHKDLRGEVWGYPDAAAGAGSRPH